MRRIIFIGILAGVTMLIVSFAWGVLSNFVWPHLAQEYQNPQLFRPWSDPAMSLFFLHPIIVGVILSWLWTKTNHLFESKKHWSRGMVFGFAYWAATVPGMIISYGTFQVSFTMVMSWSLNGLLQALLAGILFSYYDQLKKAKSN